MLEDLNRHPVLEKDKIEFAPLEADENQPAITLDGIVAELGIGRGSGN